MAVVRSASLAMALLGVAMGCGVAEAQQQLTPNPFGFAKPFAPRGSPGQAQSAVQAQPWVATYFAQPCPECGRVAVQFTGRCSWELAAL